MNLTLPRHALYAARNHFLARCLFVACAALPLTALAATSEPAQESAKKSAAADKNAQENIRKYIEPRLVEGSKIDSITKTPYFGLYEVRVGTDILYTDEKAQYVVVGNILDGRTFQNLTKARIDDISRVKFADLPFENAIKMVKGNGKRVIAVFEDPNCGYCKRFRQTLKGVDNVTVYTFLYTILSEDSVTKAKNIWCSAEPQKTLDDWMVEGKQPPQASASCNSPHEKVLETGRRLKITGTPTIFFADGSRIPGAVDAKGLEAKLAATTGSGKSDTK